MEAKERSAMEELAKEMPAEEKPAKEVKDAERMGREAEGMSCDGRGNGLRWPREWGRETSRAGTDLGGPEHMQQEDSSTRPRNTF